ncbi:hypothetical protein Tco_1503881, partial [Tanacetum coccineum]
AISSRLRAFTSFFLQIFSSAVEGTVIFNAVDGPDSGAVTGIGTDKSKITRKQSKTGKHGYENQKSTKPKPEKSSLSQIQSKNSTDKSKITRKQSKTGKHGHENQKSTKPKPEKSSLSQIQSKNNFAFLEDMDAYRNEGMGDVIFGEPFLREVGINAKWFEGMITIYNGNEEVTYQMVLSHPRFKRHTNEQCNKIPPLLKKSRSVGVLKLQDGYSTRILAHKLNLKNLASKYFRFYTSARNPVKEILLKLNLPDHRILKDGGEDFRYSDTERLSRSDEVLKLKNFKKDATLKLSKSTNQEWYEHVGPEVTRSQDDKVTR